MTRALMLAAACLTLPVAQADAETVGGLAHAAATRHAEAMTAGDAFTIAGEDDLMAQPALAEDGSVRAIVEIPSGTSAKWEVNKDDPREIHWEEEHGAPRIVDYLAYPGNYGTIPGTALPEDLGGDGDPLDILVLGQAVPRGEIVDVRLIGVLKMLDGGAQDDKLIAVMTQDSPFAEVESMDQLDEDFAGVSRIVDLWFANYKGQDGGMESLGYEGADTAREVLEAAISNYEATQ